MSPQDIQGAKQAMRKAIDIAQPGDKAQPWLSIDVVEDVFHELDQ